MIRNWHIASRTSDDRNRAGPLELVKALGLLLAPIGFAIMIAVAARPATSVAAASPDCAVWDNAASARVASLIVDDSAMADLRLTEAMEQLRRARKYCRAGFLAVARADYTSLKKITRPETAAFVPKRRAESKLERNQF